MSPNPDPLAIAFANTRSSSGRDRIANVEQFAAWAGSWPVLAEFAPQLAEAAVDELRAQRDATQLVLHRFADGQTPSPEELDRAAGPGLQAAPFSLRLNGTHVTGDGDALTGASHLVGRALVDLLLSPALRELRRCDGSNCLRVFASGRKSRRWCDSQICGNRARVAAHLHNRSQTGPDGA